MLWIISGGLVLVNAAVWIVLLRLLWRERGEKWHWKIEASTYLSRARTWQAQAEAFEAAGKTLEEHVAAERGRADRLAEALRESEDKREQLQEELASRKNALVEVEKWMSDLIAQNRMLMKKMSVPPLDGSASTTSTVMDEMRRRNEASIFTSAINEQELANIMAYNGTDEGQVDLNDE